MFAVEVDDIHEEILTETKEQPALLPGKDGVMTPEMYAIALKVVPKQIDVFIKALAEATSCGILLIFGGPNPWDEKGKISMYGFHAGEDQQGQTFGQVFPNFREMYLSLFTCFLKSAFSHKIWAAHILGENATMAEKQKDVAEGMGNMDVDGNARPAAEQDEMVGGKELSQNGQIDEVQTDEPHSNAESNNRGDHQEEEPEREANPEDDNPVPCSPRAPTPVPSSPPALPTNSREISQAPASSHMNELDSNLAVINVQDNISNTFESLDRLIMQGGLNATKSNTVKHPRTHLMHTAIEDGLITTWEKRVRSRPAPKEILTLAERARQMDRRDGDEASTAPRVNWKGGKGNLLKCGRGKKLVSA